MTEGPTSAVPRSAWVLVATRGISTLGSTLTSFGLNVWIFRQTGSFPIFAVLSTLAALPEILFAPFAGLITDRCDKKRLLLIADVMSLAMICVIWLASITGELSVVLVAVAMMLLSLTSELRWSALSPTISELVPREDLARVNGLQQVFRGINVVLGPLLGAFGLTLLGLNGMLALDILSYIIGIAGILAIRPSSRPADKAARGDSTGFWGEMTYGFRWVFARPGLRRLLLFFMLINIGLTIFVVTITPYLLSFSDNRNLGFTLAFEGAGAFTVGAYLVRRRVAMDHANAVLVAAFFLAICMFAWGIARDTRLLCVLVLLIGAATSLISACSQTIWQSNVPIATQGKVFAVRTVVAYGLTPLATLSSIPLANTVFGPITQTLAPLGATWGAGLTGALGSLISACGLLIAFCTAGLWWQGGLRVSESPLKVADATAS
ncbi:MFS transporter [Ideonella sp. 4Y16]|uniref:MFS transporter n=1 Tax=Ideonella alba TaxID=2824118 RepID=A0A940YG47_9BURK|nr:MFS transporter [Ideonella alba]MBQ0933563.1 MFS transporter [Ideonella alba]MBQ0946373.1 MFS transporter [Ideonella alba]